MKKLILISIIVLSVCSGMVCAEKTRAERDADYKKWSVIPISQLNPKTSYLVIKNTIIGTDRDRYIKLFNLIQQNGGNFNPERVRSNGGFYVTEGWTIAKIIERVPNSHVVKIHCNLPMCDTIIEGWVYLGAITSLEDYKNNQIQ